MDQQPFATTSELDELSGLKSRYGAKTILRAMMGINSDIMNAAIKKGNPNKAKLEQLVNENAVLCRAITGLP